MFKNFIVLAYRHFIRSPLSSFIELFGMTAGLTVFLLILLWVDHEMTYDEFNKHIDSIYRLEINNAGEQSCGHSTIIAPLLTDNLPEIEYSVRFRIMGNGKSTVNIENSNGTEKQFQAGLVLYTDNQFFDVFSFEFLAGNRETALTEKNTVVLTESFAKTVFADENPIGKVLNEKLVVTGVIKDVSNFHIPFKMLRSFVTLQGHAEFERNGEKLKLDRWSPRRYHIYVKLNPTKDTKALEKKISKIVWSNYPENWKSNRSEATHHFKLRPLGDIYFNGGQVPEIVPAQHGDKKKVLAYISIAFFTLLLGCINFINLNSAKSLERSKEVGIKKISGASRINVFLQFLGEVSLVCFISTILAMIFVHSLLPFFSGLLDSQLNFEEILNPRTLFTLMIGLVVICLMSGGVPAFYLSSFQPAASIKGITNNATKGFNFRKINLILQFTITIILLISTITAFRQVYFMKNADTGLSKSERIVFPFKRSNWNEKTDVVKQNLLTNPKINNVSYAGVGGVPGENRSIGMARFTLKFDGIDHQWVGVIVDEDYAKTLGLEITRGSFFNKRNQDDLKNSNSDSNSWSYNIVLNESAAKILGAENPIRLQGKINQARLNVIGVVKDFHLNSINNPIEPMFFWYGQYGFNMIADISPVDMPSTLRFVEEEVEKIVGKRPNIEFLDNFYDENYADDDNFATLIGCFTTLAILVACMGLLGVATHAIKIRIKEVGIRKIMGASSIQILNILTLPFIKTILVSAALAIPIGWVAMQSWLDNYPYRTDLPWWVFGVAITLTVAVAAFTIIWQSWRASSMNPARLIRYE
ncbi:MAG: ABC transporter permease [Cyclobacteriaceae bacterium]